MRQVHGKGILERDRGLYPVHAALDDEDGHTLTYCVMTDLPVIVLEGDERRTMKMRWDFRIPTIGKFRSPSMLVPKR